MAKIPKQDYSEREEGRWWIPVEIASSGPNCSELLMGFINRVDPKDTYLATYALVKVQV